MATTAESPLTVELKFFESHKPQWLREHRDQYVVVHGLTALGFYENFSAAYFAGAEKYGTNTDFLVKKIVEQETVFVIY